jgi:hypothetical protein
MGSSPVRGGQMGTWIGAVRRAGIGSLAAGAAALAVAACGSQLATTTGATRPASASQAPPGSASPGPPASGGSALCSHVPALTRLVVSQVSALPHRRLEPAVPAGATINDPATARAVATAVCTLPLMPGGPINCPLDRGIGYRLRFAAGRASFPVVTAAASGCTPVSGAGPVRRADSARFWTVLAHAMGGPPPAGWAFPGTGPGR